MPDYKRAACRFPGSSAEAIGFRMGLIVFLLLSQGVLAFATNDPRMAPSSESLGTAEISFPDSSMQRGRRQQAKAGEEKGPATFRSSQEVIQAAVDGVRSPILQALAGALGLKPAQIGRQAFEDSTTGMESIRGLPGGASGVAVKWRPRYSGAEDQLHPKSDLYFLSWDGKRWLASYLAPATDALTFQVLPVKRSSETLLAVTFFRDITAVPYPVIFRLRDHRAAPVWDGRSASSLFTGYAYGSIQFEEGGSGDVPSMVVTGRADPGLIVFPTSAEGSVRGFQVATVYRWQDSAYVPVRTEYTHNRDYAIYRFIAALHLHDYKAAYSFIDPAQFLKTQKPSLKLFRERIQNAWPEFTDDKIFEVPAEPVKGSGSHAFILRLGHGTLNVYHPTFTSGPAYRLAGLTRTGSKE